MERQPLETVFLLTYGRFTYRELGAGAVASGTQNQPAGQAPTTRPGRRRRPARTPSQISTKSLPPYMKEPGDHELVIFKGPSDMEDDLHDMPILEEEEEHPETRGTHRNPSLDGLESHNATLADNSTTNLIYNASGDFSMRRSVDIASLDTSGDSHGSHSELLPPHARQASEVPLEEAPPYFEVVGQDAPETSRNDPPLPETSIQNPAPGDGRTRFNFRFNPFGGSSRHPPVSSYDRAVTPDHNGSSLSLASASNGHKRNRGASGSGSGLLKIFHEHSAPMTSPSTISVDSISAPLAYTLKRSEFRAPKGGLTPEQIKLITSRDALERFGAPYGPDAVAFSASRSDMVPPPNFEATMSNSLGRSSIDLRNMSTTGGPSNETAGSIVPNATAVGENGEIASGPVISGTSTPSPSRVEGDLRSSSPSHSPPPSYDIPLADSRTSSVASFETAISEILSPITPLTARPATPVTARPLSR
ncbi:hypothetical protein K503DRAFT_784020 [Rhizopogon vinicolor AM-OR11-026]|uniref:Uncharacterized protein n=1 Tax=Rhizopogon vinicolor AM-OR11-026 TaxID=1314800 RepID=A0A1B7MWE5_9AGAM|nr:hypothetical protein K503DRAFT_784020 [Rhizopogon vinicolor AM-OR11-026]